MDNRPTNIRSFVMTIALYNFQIVLPGLALFSYIEIQLYINKEFWKLLCPLNQISMFPLFSRRPVYDFQMKSVIQHALFVLSLLITVAILRAFSLVFTVVENDLDDNLDTDSDSDTDSDEIYHIDIHHLEDDEEYDGDDEDSDQHILVVFSNGSVFNDSFPDDEYSDSEDEDSNSDEEDDHRNEEVHLYSNDIIIVVIIYLRWAVTENN